MNHQMLQAGDIIDINYEEYESYSLFLERLDKKKTIRK